MSVGIISWHFYERQAVEQFYFFNFYISKSLKSILTSIYIYRYFKSPFLFLVCRAKYDCTSWTGGTDIETEGQFVWGHSRTSFTYTNWDSNNPNDSQYQIKNRDCVDIFYNGQWNDRACGFLENFICEKWDNPPFFLNNLNLHKKKKSKPSHRKVLCRGFFFAPCYFSPSTNKFALSWISKETVLYKEKRNEILEFSPILYRLLTRAIGTKIKQRLKCSC